MSGWDTAEMAASLPKITAQLGTGPQILASNAAAAAVGDGERHPDISAKDVWGPKQSYDYGTYNKTTKELGEERAAVDWDGSGDWGFNAAVYEWKDDFGDVGPSVPDLELQLFGSEHHVKTGIQFSKLNLIEVYQESKTKIKPVRTFDDAGLHPCMLANVKLAGYNIPTPVQAYCLPAVLEGHDVVACAQTGSGKTAAFLIPTLSKLMGKAKKWGAPRPNPATFREGVDTPFRAEPLLVVICPSRELATQIFDEARRFCYRSMLRPCVIYGGGPIREQIAQLRKGCDVLIATPGRIVDFMERPEVLSLHRLKFLIIDEADEMLNPDWDTEFRKIMSGGDQETGNITYMMFSATFPKMARDLAKEHLAVDHIRIRVGRAGSTHDNIEQNIVFVEASMKRKALVDLLLAVEPSRTIIFVNTKRSADELDDFLFNLEFPSTSIHSDRTQREREDALRAFRTGKCPIIVATGVSARGLDIRNVLHVINYDLPSQQYGGIEEYTHRIGRTGRIGNQGLATSFYNEKDEELGGVLTRTLLETKQDIPDFLQQYIPEGYEEKGLKFEADSDFGDDDEGDSPWGASAAAAPTNEAATLDAVGGPTRTEAASLVSSDGFGAIYKTAKMATESNGNWGATQPIANVVTQNSVSDDWGTAWKTAKATAPATAGNGPNWVASLSGIKTSIPKASVPATSNGGGKSSVKAAPQVDAGWDSVGAEVDDVGDSGW